ncbi:Uncharacterised protein [Mycobacteroides abscessus]|nr:Uncharacterised protein [Mycobacteroides abscessus]
MSAVTRSPRSSSTASSTVPVRGAGSAPAGGWLGRHASRDDRVGTADGRSAADVATCAGEAVVGSVGSVGDGAVGSVGTSPTVRRERGQNPGLPR